MARGRALWATALAAALAPLCAGCDFDLGAVVRPCATPGDCPAGWSCDPGHHCVLARDGGGGGDGGRCAVLGADCTGLGCCADLTCVGGQCACGAQGQPCCSGTDCDLGLGCDNGQCQPCGASGQICCLGESCDPAQPLACSGGLCVACGMPGEPCCMGASCGGGAACLAGRCAFFGAAFESNDACPGCTGCDGTCENPDPYTATCGCPPGFGQALVLRLSNDCQAGGPPHGADLFLCQTPASSSLSDYAGAFELDDTCTTGSPCRVANPQTGSCSCPPDASGLTFRTRLDGCNGPTGSSLVLCLRPGVTPSGFFGGYQVDDVPCSGGDICRFPNPLTGDCSCPAGSSARDYRTIDVCPAGETPGATFYLCTP